jgi:hypothetical protein
MPKFVDLSDVIKDMDVLINIDEIVSVFNNPDAISISYKHRTILDIVNFNDKDSNGKTRSAVYQFLKDSLKELENQDDK